MGFPIWERVVGDRGRRPASTLPSLRRLVLAFAITLALGHGTEVSAEVVPDPQEGGLSMVRDAMIESDAIFADDFVIGLEPAVRDPLERMNRGIFRGNRFLDHKLLDPVTRAYRWVLPSPARKAVRGVFENLGQPGVIVNHLLQGEGKRARDTGTRFLLNTTVGIAGLWDPAEIMGIESQRADFGQTLGKAGVGSGPYLVLPVFGPNTTRDLVGDVVDIALRPDTWLLPFASQLVVGSTDGISIKDANLEAIDALEESSVDFYVAMRSAYLMDREAMVKDRAGSAGTEATADGEPERFPDPLAPTAVSTSPPPLAPLP